MIPHSAARLCNSVVTVLGGNVVLAMYQQGIGHVCFGVLLLMPVQSLRWEHFLAGAVCYKRMHRSVRAEVVPWVYSMYLMSGKVGIHDDGVSRCRGGLVESALWTPEA